jgi:ABC-type dipeptide/oligopeptide/nickel transport system ATPase component
MVIYEGNIVETIERKITYQFKHPYLRLMLWMVRWNFGRACIGL